MTGRKSKSNLHPNENVNEKKKHRKKRRAEKKQETVNCRNKSSKEKRKQTTFCGDEIRLKRTKNRSKTEAKGAEKCSKKTHKLESSDCRRKT